MLESFPQLSFQMNNGPIQNTIYTTQDPALNQLTFVISTNTEGTFFSQGTTVPKDQASSAVGSLLYLDLSHLSLTPEEFKTLVFSAEGWTFQLYAEDSQQLICMTPAQSVPLDPGNSITITVQNMALSQPPSGSSVQLEVSYYRVGSITEGSMPDVSHFKVLLQNPPHEKDKDLHKVLALSVPQFSLVNSLPFYPEVKNKLSLVLQPGPLPKDIRATKETTFVITFIYGTNPGYGALTTAEAAVKFSISRGINAQKWSITPSKDQQNPSWMLKPPEGKSIIGSGTQATVEFLIDNIITEFQPGPTLLFVSYTGVPGYQDGSYSLLLQKVPHVDIESFTATLPNPPVLTDGKVEVTLNWTVYHAGKIVLMPGYHDVTGKTRLSLPIRDTTTFTLTAAGNLEDQGNIAFKDVRAKVLPVINSFEGSPNSIYYKDFLCDVKLSWNVNTRQKVKLLSSTQAPDPNRYEPMGTITRPIKKPQMLTLIPENEENSFVKRNLLLSAFKIIPKNFSLPSPINSIAFAPTAEFVAATTMQNRLLILDTVNYRPMGAPLSVGKNPVILAFSSDSSLIFVANSGDGTVSLIQVNPTGDSPPYTFTNLAPLKTGGSPQHLALSPDNKYLYVSVDRGSDQDGSLVVFQNKGDNTYTHLSDIPLGKAPQGISVHPSGAQIFIANSGSDSISVIGVSTDTHSLVSTLSTGVKSQPSRLAVSPDGLMLLVACKGLNSVIGISTTYMRHPVYTQREENLQVGESPSHLSLLPGGTYAFVLNQGNGTVSLLQYDSEVVKIKVREANIAVGTQLQGLAIAPEGGVVLVGKGDASLSCLTLAAYEEQIETIKIPGNLPTDVLVVPDSSKVFAWHNNLLKVDKEPDSPGVFVYDRKSKTVKSYLENDAVISCAFAKAGNTQVGFVIIKNEASIRVIDTDTCQSIHQPIEIPKVETNNLRYPRSLSVSADGRKLFVILKDQQSQYSLLVFSIDIKNNTYSLEVDVVLFTTIGSTLILLCSNPDGSTAFVINSLERQLWRITQDVHGSYSVQKDPTKIGAHSSSMSISPDGSHIFALHGGMYNSLSRINTDSLKVETLYIPEMVGAISLNSLIVSPDGSKLYATDGVSTGIRIFDAASLRSLQTIYSPSLSNPYGVAILPDGSEVFIASMGSNNIGRIRCVQPKG